MAYVAVADVCTHFHSFRNIDLFHQGLYTLRVRAYQDTSEGPGGIPRGSATSGSQANGKNLQDHSKNGLVAYPPRECVALVPYAILPATSRPRSHSGALATDRTTLSSARSDRSRSLIPPASSARVDYHNVSPATVDAETHTFYTRSFLLRYCDEEIALDDACCFRLELDLCKLHVAYSPVYLEVDLMFDENDTAKEGVVANAGSAKEGDCGNRNNKLADLTDPFSSRVHDSVSEGEKRTEAQPTTPHSPAAVPAFGPATSTEPRFISVSYQVYRLNHALEGTLELVPVVFDEFHFAVCNMTIHSLLVDIRPRLRFLPALLPYFPRHRSKRPAPSLNYGANGTEQQRPTEFLAASTPRLVQSFGDIITPLRPIEFFLDEGCNAYLTEAASSQEAAAIGTTHWLAQVDRIHQWYVRLLLKSLVRLACIHRVLTRRCLNAAEEAALAPSAKDLCTHLRLPGGAVLDLTEAETGKRSISVDHPRPHQFQVTVVLNPNFCDFMDIPLDSSSLPTGSFSEPYFNGGSRSTNSAEGGFCVSVNLPTVTSRLPTQSVAAVAPLLTEDFFTIGGQIADLWSQLCLLLPVFGTRSVNALRLRAEAETSQQWRPYIIRETLSSAEIAVTSESRTAELHAKTVDQVRRALHAAESAAEGTRMAVTNIFLQAGPETQPIIFEQVYHKQGTTGSIAAGNSAIAGSDSSVFSSQEECTAATESDNRFSTTVFNSAALPGIGIGGNAKLSAKPSSIPRPYGGLHLFVLVHGFQGNSYDMRLFQNIISLSCPGAICLCSSANEENTEGDIETMGTRLAEEIDRHVSHWCGDSAIDRVSFVAHSLGGVIVRAALPKLEHLFSKFYSFVTLSSPHLGYTYSANRLIDAGMWVLKKLRKSECLQQLTFGDHKNPRESFIYKLAMERSAPLNHFKHFVVLSSVQDKYVPFESARIEVPQKSITENKMALLYAEMAQRILSHTQPSRFRRLDVDFRITEKSLDSLIGRAAHIQFLENQLLMRMLTLLWSDLFF